MDFKEKYTTLELKTTDALQKFEDQTEKNKIILSNDAFAIGEFIDLLIKKLEHIRGSLMK